MKIFGHRGAKGIAMENSLHGFQLASQHGIDRFELDVRLSSDNQLMVVHDEKLGRLANSEKKVSTSTAKQLSSTILNGIEQGIPTLEQVVTACPNVKHWQFEIKTSTTNVHFIRPMNRLIKKLKLESKITITSKHVGILKAFQRVLPNIPRGYVQEFPLPKGLKIARRLNCSMLALNKNLAKKKYIKQAQSYGLHVSIWTVNNADDMARLLNYGADSIISDFPQAAREVVTPLLKLKA